MTELDLCCIIHVDGETWWSNYYCKSCGKPICAECRGVYLDKQVCFSYHRTCWLAYMEAGVPETAPQANRKI